MIYFASDFHLGADGALSSQAREKLLVKWLDEISKNATHIYLLGDLFDYWFEYQEVIPRGFVRLLGKLGEIVDSGIPVSIFTGNHDMWMFGYLKDELGIEVYQDAISVGLSAKQFVLGHGDGLGPGDHGYKFIKRVFRNPVARWLFARIHPNTGIRLMKYFSGTSRQITSVPEFLGEDKEWLIQYCNSELQQRHVDYFIFGHRHLPIDHLLKNGISRYVNLGDWLTHNTYAVFDGHDLRLKKYNS